MKTALQKYFEVASPTRLQELHSIFFDLSSLTQKEKNYQKYHPVFQKLKPLFKQLVKERNGKKNFLKLFLAESGVDPKSWQYFQKNLDKKIVELQKRLPPISKYPDWFWTEYGLYDLFCLSLPNETVYSLPQDGISLMSQFYPEVKTIEPKIEFKFIKNTIPQTIYFPERDRFQIIFHSEKVNLHKLISFIHELAHILTISSKAKSRYWHELEANKKVFEFVKSQGSEVWDGYSADLLEILRRGIFEWEIYSHPNQDFEKAYLSSTKKCFPQTSNQEKNPFYLLSRELIEKPGYAILNAIITVNLLK